MRMRQTAQFVNREVNNGLYQLALIDNTLCARIELEEMSFPLVLFSYLYKILLKFVSNKV